MPGQVVVFWTWQKEKTAEKSCPLFENIYLHFVRSDDML